MAGLISRATPAAFRLHSRTKGSLCPSVSASIFLGGSSTVSLFETSGLNQSNDAAMSFSHYSFSTLRGSGPSVQGSGIGTDVEMISANHRIRHFLNGPSLLVPAARFQHMRDFASASSSSSSSSDDSEAMDDEYGVMDDAGLTYTYPGDYLLENGQILPRAELRYQTYGQLNEARDNVVTVCHALTGNASLHSWWGELLGPGRVFDTDRYFVVCCNILGSCYGSTSPRSEKPGITSSSKALDNAGVPSEQQPPQLYGKDFPDISVKDTVRLQLLLLKEELKINSVKAVIGGSFGGMQAVEFAVQAGSTSSSSSDNSIPSSSSSSPPFVRSVVPIACGAQHTAWQIAISEVQRQAIYKDPAWDSDNPFDATGGLEIARQLGMISYRTPMGYSQKFGRQVQSASSPAYGSQASWQVKSYLEYQGSKFLSRFDPVTYVKLTEQMDSHDVARGAGGLSVAEVLAKVQIPALVLGIDSDVLYPLSEQEELAKLLPNATLEVIRSDDGHDGFLLAQDQVAQHISDFLNRHD